MATILRRNVFGAFSKHKRYLLTSHLFVSAGGGLAQQPSQDKADKLTKSFYSSADLLLDDLGQLFNSPLYEAVRASPFLTGPPLI